MKAHNILVSNLSFRLKQAFSVINFPGNRWRPVCFGNPNLMVAQTPYQTQQIECVRHTFTPMPMDIVSKI